MKKKYVVLILVAVFFGMGMALLGWLSVRGKSKWEQYSDLDMSLFSFGSYVIEEFVAEIDATPQQARQFREILEDEFDSNLEWDKINPNDPRQIDSLEQQIQGIKHRAWYENKPPEVEQLYQKLRVMEFGDKASPPIRVAFNRIKELLTDEQKKEFDAIEDRISDEMARMQYEMNMGRGNSKKLEDFIDKSEMSEETKQLMKEMMKPYVTAKYFHHELPMDILIDEDLASLDLSPKQKTTLRGISDSYREDFKTELDRYYDQVAGQLPDLRTLCDAECYALQEGDVDSGQTFGNEIDEILNTDSLLQIFRSTLDKVEVVLDDQQKQAFGPIRENALARFADYLARSMTCENMRIVYEPCELPDATTQSGNPSTQPSPAG